MTHLTRTLAILSTVTLVGAHAATIYVDDTAGGANDGTSWANAYTDLESALAAAVSGDEVRVAAGTYKPSVEVEGTGDQYRAFQLKEGVTYKGGYPDGGGGEPSRDPATHQAILSGDIGTQGDYTDNCLSVLNHPDGTNLTAATAFDGFTITKAYPQGGVGAGMRNYSCSPTVKNCTFTGNYFSGMHNEHSSPMVTDCIFSNGGCMRNDYSSPTVTDCTFSENRYSAMENTESSPTVANCMFTQNYATGGGGMLNRSSSRPTVTNCVFSENEALSRGAGIYNQSVESSTVVTNCTFTGNRILSGGSDSHGGGAIWNAGDDMVVTDCTFSGNTLCGSGGQGGAIHNRGDSCAVINCTFTGNTSEGRGGTLSNTGDTGDTTVINCTFVGNTAREGGGVLAFGGDMTVTNCTFTGNTAQAGLGGGISSISAAVTIANCILWGNSSPIDPDPNSAPPTVTYSCVEGGWSGTGNIDLDPLLTGMRLGSDSPCIDAGDNDAVPAGVTTDIDGEDRCYDREATVDTGNGTAPIVDMGADEYWPAHPEIAVQRPPDTAIADGGADPLGEQIVGPVTITYTIDNSIGSEPLEVTDVTAPTMSNCSGFAAAPASLTVPVGGSATIEVSFDIDAAGAFGLDLAIANNDLNENPYDVHVSGTGILVPEIDVQRPVGTSIADGGIDSVGSHATGTVTFSYTIDNSGGNGVLEVTNVTATGVVNCSNFSAGSLPLQVAAGGSETVEVSFHVSAGAFQLDLHISNNDADEHPYDIRVTGTAYAPPEINVQRPAGTSIADGGADDVCSQGVGGVTLLYTIDNRSGAGVLSITQITASNLTNCSNFTASPSAQSVPAGQVRNQTVSFDIDAAGAFSLDLQIANNDLDENPYNVSISGTGVLIPGGSGTVADPYLIAVLEHLKWITENPGKWNSHFRQTADIDASATATWDDGDGGDAEGFAPIGTKSPSQPFGGSYDGDGHTISNLTVNRPDTEHVGLFGYTSNANISNLSITGGVSGQSCVGGLAGESSGGTVSNCHSHGDVTVTGAGSSPDKVYTGGLIGKSGGTAVSDCSNTGSVTAIKVPSSTECQCVGGLLGLNQGTATRCYNSGDITGVGTCSWMGGLVGYSLGTQSDCYNTGDVMSDGGMYVGGLIGVGVSATTQRCYSTGSVSGSSSIGGLAGMSAGGSVTDLFWDTEASGLGTSPVGTGKTTAEMKDAATFTATATAGLTTAWDFVGTPNDDGGSNDDWDISASVNRGYPYLTSNPPLSGPEIDVQRPTGNSIANGGSDALGTRTVGTIALTYTIDNNAGSDQLEVTDVTASALSNCNGFSATPSFLSVAAGASDTIEVSFTAVLGAFSLDLEIANNDSDEGAYAIAVSGTADTPPTATDLTQTQPYAEGTASVALDDIVVTDPDVGDIITATLTLADPATGALSATSGNGETYTPGTGVWTVTGTVAAVNAALADVVFSPMADNRADTTVTTHVEDVTGYGPTDGTITLDVTPAPRDFGDLPPAYGLTLWANDGARHLVGSVYLGAAVDAEADGQECADAGRAGDAGDDNAVGTDDEDGVTVVGPWRNGVTGGAVQVTVTGGSGYLSAWIDWAGNDDLSDAGDQVLVMAPVSAGTQTLTFDIPAGVITTEGAYERFARFRLDDDNAQPLAPTGAVDNGEVEDYYLQFDGVLNAAPTDIALSNDTVPENEPAGTVVGTLIATDADAGDTHTYSLVAGTGDTHNALFAIDGDTLETAAVLDYEATSTCSLRVQTDDGKGGTYQEVFTVTVLDGPNLAIAPDSADNAEGDAGDTAFTFTVTRTGDTAGAVSATWTVSGSGGDQATADDFDTVFPTGTVSFADGDTEETITVNVTGDAMVEPDEGFDVTLSAPSAGAEIATASASGTIRNDDTLVVEFDQGAGGDTETGGGNLPQLLVTGTVQAGHSVTIDVAVTGGTAQSPADFAAPTTLTVTGGTYSAETFAIPSLAIVGGSTVEPDETLELGNITGSAVTVGDANGDSTTQSGTTYTVTDDDMAEVRVAKTTDGAETGPVNGVFGVTQTALSSTDTVLGYTVAGTATSGADYTALTGSVTIPAGATFAAITVSVTDDAVVEAVETVTVTLDSITDGDLDISIDGSHDDAALDIADNDKASLTIDDISLAEAGTFSFIVTSNREASADMTVLASTAADTATADFDFTAFADQLVTIAAGATSAAVTVTVEDEAIVEANETFFVNLTDPKFDGAADPTRVEIGDNQGRATIENNDTASLSVDDIALTEDGTFTFTVTSDKEASADMTVVVNTDDETATSPADFTAITDQTVTIPAGATSATVTITVVDDELVEDAETFVVDLTDPRFNDATDASRVGIGDSQGQATIENNEMDCGDAPDSYGTTLAGNGARHTCVYGFQLGAAIDGDADGQPNADATGDDADAHGDDEDGIVFNADLVKAAADTACSVTVTASDAGRLDAWLDLDNDGVFAHPGERIIASRDVPAGDSVVSFAVPSSAVAADTFVRFRFSYGGGLLPTGAAGDGEVEDYRVTIVDRTTPGDVVVNVPSCGEDFEIVLDGTGTDVIVQDNEGNQLLQVPCACAQSLTITGTGDDDTFTVNFGNGDPIPPGGVTIIGGDGSDDMTVINGLHDWTTFSLTGPGAGSVDFDSDTAIEIVYSGFEPVDTTGSQIANLVFNLAANATDVVLDDYGTGVDGNSQLRFTTASMEDHYFQNPTDSVTINAQGGGSVIHLGAMDSGYGPAATTFTGVAGDTFRLTAANVIPDSTALTLTAATLDLDGNSDTVGSLAGSGPVSLGNATLTCGGNDDSTDYSGVINGTGGLRKLGTGVMTVSGLNTYSGTTDIDAGTLQLGASGVLDDGSAVEIDGSATLDLAGNDEAIASLAGGGNVTLGTATLTTGVSDASTSFVGIINGAGGLTKAGTGTFTLSGANTYTGATTVSAGTLQLDASDVIPDDSDVTVSGTFDLAGHSDTIGALSGAGTIMLGAGTLTAGDDTDTVFTGTISGGGAFTKNGAGMLTLAAANTYTGATAVEGGTLLVSSSLATASVTVNTDATLKGVGPIAGTLSVTGGTVAPGGSPGKLQTGSVSFDTDSTFAIELTGTAVGTQYDQLDVTGTVSLGSATLTGSVTFAPTPGTTFVIINNDGGDPVNGTFGGMAEGATIMLGAVEFSISYIGGDGNDVELTTAPPAITYVDDDWAGTTPGDDPDGPGPAQAFGWNSFDTVQGGVSGVRTDGTVYVYSGTYNENVLINKALTLTRAGDMEVPVLDGTATGGTGISVNATGVALRYLTVQDYSTGILVSGSGAGTIHYCCIQNNGTYGVNNTTGSAIDATENWWGDPSGPYDAVGNQYGDGDTVSTDVTYSPWWEDNVGTGLFYAYIDRTEGPDIQAELDALTAGWRICVDGGPLDNSVIYDGFTLNKEIEIHSRPGCAFTVAGNVIFNALDIGLNDCILQNDEDQWIVEPNGIADIQDAVDAAYNGDASDLTHVAGNDDIVFLKDGEYLLTAGITVPLPLMFLTETGHEYTTVDGNDSYRCFNVTETLGRTLFDDITIRNGNAGGSEDGGAIRCAADVTIKRCWIYGCTARDGGGVFLAQDGYIRNTIISDNMCYSDGGGLYSFSGATLENVTIAGNGGHYLGTNPTGGGAYFFDGGTVTNTIIYNCRAEVDENFHDQSGNVNVTYSCIYPLVAGTGNIEDDPQFGSAADFTLQYWAGARRSPCLDTGSNLAWHTDPVEGFDMIGNDRIILQPVEYGGIPGAPATVDMGALECTFTDQPLPFAEPDFVNAVVTLSPSRPAPGSTYTASITIKNMGRFRGNPGWVEIWLSDSDYEAGAESNAWVRVGPLLPYESVTRVYPGLTAPMFDTPMHTILIECDGQHETDEESEENNVRIQGWYAP